MKNAYRTLLIGLLAIGLLDTIGSIASKQLDFNYSLLFPVSFIIYGTTAFFVTRQNGLKIGVLFAAAIGLFEATIGWKLSMLLDANTGDIDNETTTGLWIMTAVLITGLAAFIGLIGGIMTRIVKKKNINT